MGHDPFTLRPTPSQPVFDGQIHFGTFKDPFQTVNVVDADIYGHKHAPRWWRNLRLKEWQHCGLIHDDCYCGFTIFDAKYMAVSFVYVYDRTRGTVIEHNHTTLQRGAIHVPDQLWRGDGFFRQHGYYIAVQNRLGEGEHRVTIDARTRHKLPALQAEFTIHEDLAQVQPLIVVLPINNYRRPLYTHKAACPVSGSLRVGDQQWTFDAARDWAMVDVQKTFYPYHGAFWKWAAFAGRDQDGVPVAINLTHNMIRDDAQWNECCAWIDGTLHRLGAARFEYDPRATQQPWHIITQDGRVDLRFTPQGERAERINVAGLIRSDFHQPFGTFQGTVIDDVGTAHTIDDAFGVTEHHMLKA